MAAHIKDGAGNNERQEEQQDAKRGQTRLAAALPGGLFRIVSRIGCFLRRFLRLLLRLLSFLFRFLSSFGSFLFRVQIILRQFHAGKQ